MGDPASWWGLVSWSIPSYPALRDTKLAGGGSVVSILFHVSLHAWWNLSQHKDGFVPCVCMHGGTSHTTRMVLFHMSACMVEPLTPQGWFCSMCLCMHGRTSHTTRMVLFHVSLHAWWNLSHHEDGFVPCVSACMVEPLTPRGWFCSMCLCMHGRTSHTTRMVLFHVSLHAWWNLSHHEDGFVPCVSACMAEPLTPQGWFCSMCLHAWWNLSHHKDGFVPCVSACMAEPLTPQGWFCSMCLCMHGGTSYSTRMVLFHVSACMVEPLTAQGWFCSMCLCMHGGTSHTPRMVLFHVSACMVEPLRPQGWFCSMCLCMHGGTSHTTRMVLFHVSLHAWWNLSQHKMVLFHVSLHAWWNLSHHKDGFVPCVSACMVEPLTPQGWFCSMCLCMHGGTSHSTRMVLFHVSLHAWWNLSHHKDGFVPCVSACMVEPLTPQGWFCSMCLCMHGGTSHTTRMVLFHVSACMVEPLTPQGWFCSMCLCMHGGTSHTTRMVLFHVSLHAWQNLSQHKDGFVPCVSACMVEPLTPQGWFCSMCLCMHGRTSHSTRMVLFHVSLHAWQNLSDHKDGFVPCVSACMAEPLTPQGWFCSMCLCMHGGTSHTTRMVLFHVSACMVEPLTPQGWFCSMCLCMHGGTSHTTRMVLFHVSLHAWWNLSHHKDGFVPCVSACMENLSHHKDGFVPCVSACMVEPLTPQEWFCSMCLCMHGGTSHTTRMVLFHVSLHAWWNLSHHKDGFVPCVSACMVEPLTAQGWFCSMCLCMHGRTSHTTRMVLFHVSLHAWWNLSHHKDGFVPCVSACMENLSQRKDSLEVVNLVISCVIVCQAGK